MFIDESHVTVPQVRGMSGGDLARKRNLIDFGFRLPSAFDNRPLNFNEFESKLNQVVFVSATPADYEKENSTSVAEQLIRPTGLIDPEIEVRPIETQVDDVMGEIRLRAEAGERVLVTTLTTKMAEDLTEYLAGNGIKVKYIHHNVDTIERMEIIRSLRLGEFDVLVGINLLREGLDIPEVSLVAILDADKEGLFRSETSLIQTIGRAARNAKGKVIMYADTMTRSMKNAIGETNRRRSIQSAYNEANGIIPKTVIKGVHDVIDLGKRSDEKEKKRKLSAKDKEKLIEQYTAEMREASRKLEFEKAAFLRDKIKELKTTKQVNK
jgi:excinuclease ABC subunit B